MVLADGALHSLSSVLTFMSGQLALLGLGWDSIGTRVSLRLQLRRALEDPGPARQARA